MSMIPFGFSPRRPPIIAILGVVAAIGLLAQTASARPPASVVRELRGWLAAVHLSPEKIAARLKKGESVFFRDRTEWVEHKRWLDSQSLLERLHAGDAGRLGLAPTLILPTLTDLRLDSEAGTYTAEAPECPEVRWTFAHRRGRWRLLEVLRLLPDC